MSDIISDERPLEGLTVFDAAQGVAGPHCSLLLAQYGANVVKIEPPRGDWVRNSGEKYGDLAAGYVAFNRGKRSICIDLKTEEGLEVARRIANRCDILVESFRPAVMGRFGLDYDSVRKENPNLIYCSMSGFGPKGPLKHRPVTDLVAQSFSGFMSLNKGNDGTPHLIGITVMDVITGIYAYQAIATALYHRAMTGRGKHIETSLMEAAGAFQTQKIIEYVKQDGNVHVLGAPAGSFKTTDGTMNINARETKKFVALCGLIERPDLVTDPRFVDWDSRMENAQELFAILAPYFAKKSNAYWITELDKIDIIHNPTFTYGDFLESPQTRASGFINWVDHEGIGKIPMPIIPGLPPFEPGPYAHAPHVGEHTEVLLAEFDYDKDKIAAMLNSGAAVQYDPDPQMICHWGSSR